MGNYTLPSPQSSSKNNSIICTMSSNILFKLNSYGRKEMKNKFKKKSDQKSNH